MACTTKVWFNLAKLMLQVAARASKVALMFCVHAPKDLQLRHVVLMQVATATTGNPNLDQLSALQSGIQILINAYGATLKHCSNQNAQ